MFVSDDYPWAKLFREYAMYCAVGCFNVAVFAMLYLFFKNYNSWTGYVETVAWAISFLISSVQAYALHRWLTFESDSEIRSSFTKLMTVYGALWAVSTFTFYIMFEIIGISQLVSWVVNTSGFGFLTFLCLRFYAFPLADGRVTRKERLDAFIERRRS
jgi:putative flippase GtrA|tara:strand:+ start:87670 stop:88143 length:474 start_codon:yes stop_codon:yes gene_type:complete